MSKAACRMSVMMKQQLFLTHKSFKGKVEQARFCLKEEAMSQAYSDGSQKSDVVLDSLSKCEQIFFYLQWTDSWPRVM